MFKPNSPGCGCYVTASRYPESSCLIKVQWCTQGTSPTLDLGSGPTSGPFSVDRSGYLLTTNKGPFTLRSDGCKGPISCVKAAISRCVCSDPVPGSGGTYDAAGFRRVAKFDQLNPTPVTCSASWLGLGSGNSATATGYLSVTGTPFTVNLDYPKDENCLGGPSTPFAIEFGSFTEVQTFSGTVTLSGVPNAFGGTRTTTFDVQYGWNGTAWYWRLYNGSTTITGTDVRSILSYTGGSFTGSCPAGGGLGDFSFLFFFNFTGFAPYFFGSATNDITVGTNAPPVRDSYQECIVC